MDTTLENIEVKLRRNAEREIIACPNCKMITKRLDESWTAMTNRAWEHGDYFIELEEVLPGFAPGGMLMVPCQDHVKLIIDQDEVRSQLQFQRRRTTSDRDFLDGAIRLLGEREDT